ncbi:unnamed protein product [Paramecium primaurelia]|uniref:Uncharacterized protein n=1 Tax=Paramecium primaurelia TaxID=5886 RepID=A0A8S1NVK0_PARPR|nr:unnamed protein product [Paramecium primaurelia]
MQKILAIALLILCITARKHHKQEEGQTDPMAQCLQDNCMDQAFECVFNEQCTQTMESCNKEHGEDIKLDDFVSCTANDEVASAFAACMRDHCASLESIMRFFNRRN